MNPETAEAFAREWVNAWNEHDIEAIMAHYSEEIVFTSPLIAGMGVSPDGVIKNKVRLQEYFEIGLQKYPGLHFDFIRCLSGLNSVVIYYKSINDLFSAEFMELNEEGKVVRVNAHYGVSAPE